MSEQAGPPSKQVQAVKQVQELIKDGDDAVIVGVFSSEQDAAYEIYTEACKYLHVVVFVFVDIYWFVVCGNGQMYINILGGAAEDFSFFQ